MTSSALIIDYRLEVDEFTVVFIDVPAILGQAELAALSDPRQFYDTFARAYAPILAANLNAKLDGHQLPLKCVEKSYRLHDDNGIRLDHLRFDFHFRCSWQIAPVVTHSFEFHEGNYELEDGLINLSITSQSPAEIASKTEPEAGPPVRVTGKAQPNDENKRRSVRASFVVSSRPRQAANDDPIYAIKASPQNATRLFELLINPGRGLWILLLLSASFGAVHALQPGHGKTLAAAYLVGEHGTVGHAFILGVVTTLTHTGAVLLLAACLLIFYPNRIPDNVQTVLGLGGGLIVAGMGVWLFLRRLTNKADHFHLGGFTNPHHPHSQGNGHGHRSQDVLNLTKSQPSSGGWLSVILLGISGGIIPCWDAIAMFGFGIAAQRVWLALELLMAFSTGLAAVLIVIGILVVRIRRFAQGKWDKSPIIKSLPLASATLVTALGLWLCYCSIHSDQEKVSEPKSLQVLDSR